MRRATRDLLVGFKRLVFLFAICLALLVANRLDAQDLGHKMPGLVGLDAGRIPQPGLYLVNRVASYRADELRNRQGNLVPIGDFQLRALANGAGVSYTFPISKTDLLLTITGAVPVARLRVTIQDRPEASIDRFGLTDFYIQPARLGWRKSRFDLVGAYGLYLPSGISILAGGKGVSAGEVTHQFSAGGTIYVDKERTVFVTALTSYDLNLRKRGVDITRGDTVQVQGGAGVSRFDRVLEVGLAGYWLRQVRSDRGADIPHSFEGNSIVFMGSAPKQP